MEKEKNECTLSLLSEAQDIGSSAEVLVSPELTSETHTSLDLIRDEEDVISISELAELLPVLRAEVVVTSLSLNRLEKDSSYVVALLLEDRFDLSQRATLGLLCALQVVSNEREGSLGVLNTMPLELREVHVLVGVGGVGEGESVAATPVEGLLEVNNLLSGNISASLGHVSANLPIEGSLEKRQNMSKEHGRTAKYKNEP
jgi:hypothetical protein